MDFKRGQDPIKSLGLGYGNKMDTKAWKILQFIGSKGEEGAGLTDIQKFIWTELQERSLKDFEMSSNDKWGYNYPSLNNKTRATRGYYNTNLYGSGSKPGLLHKYCRKNEKGKWVLVRMPDPGENIYENEGFKLVPESLNEMLIKKNRYIK